MFDPFEINFCVLYEIEIQLQSFARGYSVVLAPFVEKHTGFFFFMVVMHNVFLKATFN